MRESVERESGEIEILVPVLVSKVVCIGVCIAVAAGFYLLYII